MTNKELLKKVKELQKEQLEVLETTEGLISAMETVIRMYKEKIQNKG